MSDKKKFTIGSKTQEEFFSQYAEEAVAEHMICDLLSNVPKEDIEEILSFLENKK